jgi:hypothetical protein
MNGAIKDESNENTGTSAPFYSLESIGTSPVLSNVKKITVL